MRVSLFFLTSSLWAFKTQEIKIRKSVKDMKHAEFTSLLSDKNQPINNQAELLSPALPLVLCGEDRNASSLDTSISLHTS